MGFTYKLDTQTNTHAQNKRVPTASVHPTMSNPNVLPSPTMMGITAWAISPASAGTRFWCGNNNAQTPNKDSLATPAGAKTNFSLSNIDTPNGLFSSFWTNKQNGLDTPKLASEAHDSDFVDLDASKPEPSNSILDVMDMKMPPTPKKQAKNQTPVSVTEHRRREINLGDYSIVQQTNVSLVPNYVLNKNMNGAPLPTLP